MKKLNQLYQSKFVLIQKIKMSKISFYNCSNRDDGRQYEMENLAEYLHNTERVLCFTLSNYKEINETAFFILDTWGKRCNKLIFFSDKQRKFNDLN